MPVLFKAQVNKAIISFSNKHIAVCGKDMHMERAVSVSRHDRCPICGKSDWCRFLPANSKVPGARIVNCKRDTVFQDQISSIDGRTYVFIKKCNDLSSLYIDEEIHRKEREIWRQEHGFSAKDEKRRPIKKDAKQPVEQQEPEEQKVYGACKPLADQKLDDIYRSFLSLLQLNSGHRTYLLRERWAKELIEKSLVRSLPSAREYTSSHAKVGWQYRSRREITEELVREFGELMGVPGFYEKGGLWTFAGKQGLIFPLYNRKGQIYRLRIRVDYPAIDENGKAKNKYHNFSSFREERRKDGTLYNYYLNGTQANSQIGFYNQFTKDHYVVYITEGEKKALVANYVLGQPVICVPGVSSFRKPFEADETGVSVVDHAIGLGAKVFVIAYDADKSVNAKVLQCEGALVERLKDKGVQIALADWNMGFGKGLDDILGIGIRPNLNMVTE